MSRHAIVAFGARCVFAALLPWSLGASAVPMQPAPPADWQFTPLTESVLSPPRWFNGTDGKVHLAQDGQASQTNANLFENDRGIAIH